MSEQPMKSYEQVRAEVKQAPSPDADAAPKGGETKDSPADIPAGGGVGSPKE